MSRLAGQEADRLDLPQDVVVAYSAASGWNTSRACPPGATTWVLEDGSVCGVQPAAVRTLNATAGSPSSARSAGTFVVMP